MLRARPRARNAGQHRRGGRRHRRPVDRRAGHPADDADLPHRRRGAAQRAVEPRIAGRRHDRVSRHADDRRPARPAPVAVALGRNRDPRHGRARAVDAPRALWRAPAVRERPYRQPRRPHRRVGSVVQPGDHREGRYREVPGPDREPDDDRAGRRVDRHHPARGHRRHGQVEEGVASPAPHPDRQGGRGSGRLSPRPRSDRRGRGRAAGRGRRSAGAHAARSRADARHHRRSAARRRAVRGAQAEGECDHRQGLRQGHLHARLQGQAEDRDRPRRRVGAGRDIWCPSRR